MSTPWLDGHYRYASTTMWVFKIQGETLDMLTTGYLDAPTTDMMKGTIKYGDFGDARAEVAEATGKKTYDVETVFWGGQMKSQMVLSDDKKSMTMWSFFKKDSVDKLYWLSEEEVKQLQDSGDPIDCIPSPYKLQPENQGKLIWLSGPPGAGKSTSAQLLARNNDFVYFEADAVMSHANPYVPVDVENPTMAQFLQNHLTGFSLKDLECATDGEAYYQSLTQDDKDFDMSRAKNFYRYMSQMIQRERKRIGGHWAVAQAVPTRELRDVIRETLGSEVFFVLINLSRETQEKRIKNRHGDDEASKFIIDMCVKLSEAYEKKGADEDNAVDVLVTEDMSPEDVVKKIQSQI